MDEKFEFWWAHLGGIPDFDTPKFYLFSIFTYPERFMRLAQVVEIFEFTYSKNFVCLA